MDVFFKIFLVFLGTISCGFCQDLMNELKIVNGNDSLEEEFPFAVSLRTFRLHSCGGTILNSKYVLTAAHCVRCFTGITRWYSIQYGSYKISRTRERSVGIKKIHCNGWNPITVANDIAVLELEEELPEGTYQPVKLAKSFNGTKRHNGTIIGWGRVSTFGFQSKILQKANVNVYEDFICDQKNDAETKVCFGAPNVGACYGDSGTALMINGEQVGITSYGLHFLCGISNETYPNVYTRVPYYYNWIAQVAGLEN